MITSQMLKGVLEGCILTIIGDDEIYGYEISQKLEKYGFEKVSEGTIYPMLLRLERNDEIEPVFKESPNGPKRKYYHLTPKGKEKIEEFNTSWKELENIVNKIFGGREK